MTDLMLVRQAAMRYLARREHSAQELKRKLATKGFDLLGIDKVVTEYAEQGLQSDERYTTSYINHRAGAGFGPKKIALELRKKGISDALIQRYLVREPVSGYWQQRLYDVWQRKFVIMPDSMEKYAKQVRFLVQRGFDADSIHNLVQLEKSKQLSYEDQ